MAQKYCKELYSRIQRELPKILSLRQTGKLKPDGTFVSEGDIMSERLVVDYFRHKIEDCVIVSEESPFDVVAIEKAMWLVTVDPIDGTENFVSGLKEWGMGVSIYHQGKHYESMIALPELDICLITGESLDTIDRSRICGLSSYMNPGDFEQLRGEYEYRIMGCCMYNMYNVIRGSYAKFSHLKGCYSWDILPGMNLALEHGKTVILEDKPYSGEFLMPGVKYRFTVF